MDAALLVSLPLLFIASVAGMPVLVMVALLVFVSSVGVIVDRDETLNEKAL